MVLAALPAPSRARGAVVSRPPWIPAHWPKWAAEDAQERAAIRQHDGMQNRHTAERDAVADVSRLLRRHGHYMGEASRSEGLPPPSPSLGWNLISQGH